MDGTLQRLNKLLQAIKDSELISDEKNYYFENVERYVRRFPEYFNTVINFSTQSMIARMRYEGQDYRDYMQKLDSDRRSKHMVATDAINVLNRMAKSFGTDLIFPLSRELDSNTLSDREIAVKLIYGFCTEVFIDEVERTGYNIGKGDIDAELYHMSEAGVRFHTERFRVDRDDDFER